MSSYLLDTNACIAILKGNPVILNHVRRVGLQQLYLCTPVKAELWFGACKSVKVIENQQKLESFFIDIPSLAFDDHVFKTLAELRMDLFAKGTPIGPYDMQIAAIALIYDLTIVTHNLREFERVPNLRIEDWLI
ncbi:MAG: type II toxin-antitoxin system VapC family toxin [Pseudomonadales bacterium]|nr:type II toxin-antitoxin system VapC family toxin [Pseudomonadales bacterium]